MKLTIGDGAARAAAFAAVAARVFMGLSIQVSGSGNGAWLSALLGGLLALPWLLWLGARPPAFPPLMALLSIATVADSAAVLSTIVRSAGFLALDHIPAIGLALPVGLSALWCLRKGGDAIGYGAMLWLRLSPALLLVVVALQAKSYQAAWLWPLLGDGWPSVFVGGLRAAGWIVAASSILLVRDSPDGPRRHGSLLYLSLAAVVAALLLALQKLMSPMRLQGDDWVRRLDVLLTNGRAPLYLQLPMIVLWLAGLLHLLACECFASAALLRRVIPAMNDRLCAALALTGAVAPAVSLPDVIDGLTGPSALWLYFGAGMTAALGALWSKLTKRGEHPCA